MMSEKQAFEKKSKFASILGTLARDRGGNFGIMTALLMVPLSIAAGMAVDYSTSVNEQGHLQEIADGAALAGGKIFDGTNLADAQTVAKAFISAYSSSIPKDTTSQITANGRTLLVSLGGSVPTSLMQLANVKSVNIGATAGATAPEKPQKVTLTPTQAQGYYYKVISVIVVRPGTTKEVVLATVTYQPNTHNNAGQGPMVQLPGGQIDLGKYTKLVLQMDIKNDGCPIGQTASVSSKNEVSCSASSTQANSKYNLTLRTDNPATSYYLFVDGQQLPANTTMPIQNYFGCQKTQTHAWEDGGGWQRQDFFYTISSECTSADGDFVRLTQ
jgi:Flp pilus assembly protein TadG